MGIKAEFWGIFGCPMWRRFKRKKNGTSNHCQCINLQGEGEREREIKDGDQTWVTLWHYGE